MSIEDQIENADVNAVDLIEAVGVRLKHRKDYNKRYSVDSFMRVLLEEAAHIITEQDRRRQQQDRKRLI